MFVYFTFVSHIHVHKSMLSQNQNTSELAFLPQRPALSSIPNACTQLFQRTHQLQQENQDLVAEIYRTHTELGAQDTAGEAVFVKVFACLHLAPKGEFLEGHYKVSQIHCTDCRLMMQIPSQQEKTVLCIVLRHKSDASFL